MNRDNADAEYPFPLFFSFSASFKNSSPREKVAKNCLRFGTGGPSLCLYSLLVYTKTVDSIDWLVKLQISCAIYLGATREKMASRFASVSSEEITKIN